MEQVIFCKTNWNLSLDLEYVIGNDSLSSSLFVILRRNSEGDFLESIEFLVPHLKGKRFQDHAIPISVFKDLAALEVMIIEVAKWKFFNEEVDRKRMPNGFYESVDLRVVDIEEGSAVPRIKLFFASIGLFNFNYTEYFTEARDDIMQTIIASEMSEDFESIIPTHSLRHFKHFGKSLREDESIELFVPNKAELIARVNNKTRPRLYAAATDETQIEKTFLVRGIVPEYDQENKVFRISNAWGKRTTVPVLPEFETTVLNAFNGYSNEMKVLLEGSALCKPDGRFKEVNEVSKLSILHPLDVHARIDELVVKCSKKGWLNGDGEPITQRRVQRFVQAYDSFFNVSNALPYTYPTEDGNVLLEWTFGSKEASLEIKLDTLIGEWHVLDVDTMSEEEIELSLGHSDGWSILEQKLLYLGRFLV